MPTRRTWCLLLIALALRLLALGWDADVPATSLHPDERQVAYVTERMEGWFSNPEFFAYGSLHFQVIRLVAVVLSVNDAMRGLIVSGRLLSLASSMLALILGWTLARRAWGRRTADLFLLLVAFVPLDLQQSHFATVEAHHTLWIMAAIAGCFWLATGGGARASAAAGAAVGASLAVKVASLALGLPLGLALLLAARARGVVELVRLTAIAVGVGVTAYWICQPWAFVDARPPWVVIASTLAAAILVQTASGRSPRVRAALVAAASASCAVAALQGAALLGLGGHGALGNLVAAGLVGDGINPAYLKGVGEQVRMVMGEADLPYVRVFVNTLPVLYPLRELVMWAWGPLLVLAVAAAAVAGGLRLSRRWRRWLTGRWNASSILLLLVLAWLLPMAVRLSTLYVKYLRYWEPLVVPAVLLAAWWLTRLPERFRRRCTLTVVAGTVLWGVAYLWAFADPHAHGVASRWLTPLLEPGQVVAFETWDETIGLPLDEGGVETIHLPSYDLPDDDSKIERWCEQLDRADWVVLTSNRVMRTILANPERFERTGRLYRLLLSNEAGFEVLARAVRGPRLFGLRWPVQLADESFVNYEFPQVLILRRVGPVPTQEIVERVSRPLPFAEKRGLTDVQNDIEQSVPIIPPVPDAPRQFIDTAVWLLVFGLLGFSCWVLLLPLLRSWPDAGVGLALTTGWIVPAFFVWIGTEFGMWSTGAPTVTWVLLLLIAGGTLAATARWHEVTTIWRRRRSMVLTVLAVGVGVGAFFLVVRAMNPAIHWGEKPMDFAFLNAFLRADTWPTGEPWMAGMPLHYYYFGQILASFPILVTGCTAAVGYNLMSATIPALTAVSLASLGLLLAGRRRRLAAVILPVLVLFTGNLAWPWLLDMARAGKWFDTWWATSRVIPGFAIDEYPLWTAFFADLHGHFIALPVMVATLAWGWVAVHTRGRRWLVAAVMTGIGAAVLVATNPWDVFILSGALGIGTLATARRPLMSVARLVTAAAVSVLAAGPFIVELVAGLSAGAGSRGLFLTAQDFAPAWAVLRHFGLFLAPLGVLGAVILRWRLLMVAPLAAVGVFIGLSFGSSAAALALAAAALFAVLTSGADDRLTRLAWSLATLGVLAVAACERFTLIDRMNTIFKVYNGVWLLLAATLAVMIFRTRGGRRTVLLATWLPLQAMAMVNLPLGAVQGWLQPRMASPKPTLNGQAFLPVKDPETWFLVRALQGAARPGETVAESAGNYYSQHTRIAMHTGQPTVIGWEWHLTQRGQSVAEIRARFADLETLYAGRDPAARRKVLDRYRVRWAVLGQSERQTYNLGPDASLGDIPGVVKVAAREGADLYLVRPISKAPAPVVERPAELPTGVAVLGRLPRPESTAAKSLHRDAEGGVAVLADGRVVILDQSLETIEAVPAPGCSPASAVRFDGRLWLLCDDGRIMRRVGESWRLSNTLTGARQLAADGAMWGWGDGGLWRLGSADPQRVSAAPVTAAAANGLFVAWSDGSQTWIGREQGRPVPVVPALEAVRTLAWDGPNLWALDGSGLRRSGGGILPWRLAHADLGAVEVLAGGADGVWALRRDGVVLGMSTLDCPAPWTPSSGHSTSGLQQPRGLAESPDGWFAVVDTMNSRIRWYSDGGVCLDEFGSKGTGAGMFNEPSGLDLAGDGRLAVADTWNGRIQVVYPDGSVEIAAKSLFGPREVLWSPDGSLLVADTGNRRVLRLAPPAWEMEVVVELDGPVVGLSWAGDLFAAATPAAGSVSVVDPGDGRVVRTIEIPGWVSGEQQEGYLVTLPSGEIAASAPKPGEIWLLDSEGTKDPQLLRADLPGVTDMVVQPDGILLVSLTWDHRLVRIDLKR